MKVEKKIQDYLSKIQNNYEDYDEVLIERIDFILRVLKESEELIDELGVMVKDNRGNVKKNPAVDIWKQYEDKLERLLRTLSATPQERKKSKNLLEADDGFED